MRRERGRKEGKKEERKGERKEGRKEGGEGRGGGRPSEGIVTRFHGKYKQFLSLVSSGDKKWETDCTDFQEVKSTRLNAPMNVATEGVGVSGTPQAPPSDHHCG